MARARGAIAVLVLMAVAGCGGDDRATDAREATATSPGAQTAPATTAGTSTTPAATTPTTPTPATKTTPATTPPAPARPDPRRRPQSDTDRVSNCLTKAGYRLQGGAPQLDDADAPEYEIILSGARGGGFIGFYATVARAKRLAGQLRKNAQRINGADVERHGAINIVWVDLPDAAARAAVRACLVT